MMYADGDKPAAALASDTESLSAAAPCHLGQPWNLYTQRQRGVYLLVLFLVSTSNYVDRNIVAVLFEPIKQEYKISDAMLGLLGGLCFALFYAVAGLPIARWADRGNRRNVIAVSLAVWSLMTVLCGVTRTFWQLALARVGVGAGESGSIPSSQSLIVDYFPPERRGSALGVFTSASTAGYLLAFGAGGYIAATFGWRWAFIATGLPGIVLVLLVLFVLPEPRLQTGRNQLAAAETIRVSAVHLWRKRSFVYALAACMAYFFFAYGGLVFIPAYLVRVLHSPPVVANETYGLVTAGGSLLGTLGGGALVDHLSRRDTRWLAWLPAGSIALAGPVLLLALRSDHLSTFLIFGGIAWILLSAGVPPIFAAIHAVCGHLRRGTAIAIVLFSATLFGGGFGPLATGFLSDTLSKAYGPVGLRYSLMTMAWLPMLTGGILYRLSQAMSGDLEE